ncbi:hypothetical protein BDN70DRAFT_891146 [Pholiota conissans]|uniref:Uncharacterized protein n=1 Tax=Pholiota conissans TaxID=109636 RepID=A0A9P6D5L4_9AGAR|nr:hypothetical protein BDN70DRAFT_891146 [Pholiota conissans]
MSFGIQAAFREILQNPCLKQLQVCALRDAPRDLLRMCSIQQLHLMNIGFSEDLMVPPTESDGILSERHMEQITTFVTDHSTSPLECIGTDAYNASMPPPKFTVLPQLQKLVCRIFHDRQYDMTVALMKHAENAKKFSLSFNEPKKSAKTSIQPLLEP